MGSALPTAHSGGGVTEKRLATPRTGGEILVANLLAQDATHVFCVPGESYLAVLDALYDVRDRVALLVCRNEGGAAYMRQNRPSGLSAPSFQM